MKNYYMCDIHFHTNNSFDAFKKNKFDIKNLYDILKGSDVTSNVKLVCFTDHNYFNYFDYLSSFNELRKYEILCLPGIEINTTNKVHWIFIFNNCELEEYFDGQTKKGEILQQKIFEFYKYNKCDNHAEMMAQTSNVQNNPIDISDFLDLLNGISIEYLAIPHFDKTNGWFNHIKKDEEQLMLLEYFIKDNIIFGVESKRIKEQLKDKMKQTQKYIDEYVSLYETLDLDDEEKRNNTLIEIQKRKDFLLKTYKIDECLDLTSVIYGSDYHGDKDYNKDNLFLIKSELSFEGLKFAFLDHESRIMSKHKYEIYAKDNNYIIDKVTIIENGVEKIIEFGDGLNCIIGSRGSGKTYFLSMLLGNTEEYNIINKSIRLKEIQHLNHSSQNKLAPEMFDYVSQKNSAGLKNHNKSNIYNLLARAPYDYHAFEKELENNFNKTPDSKNDIQSIINKFNEIIIEYNEILKIKNNNLDVNFIDAYNDFFKNQTENVEIFDIFNQFDSFLKNVISKKEIDVYSIVEYKKIYDKFLEQITNVFKIKEVKNNISDEEMKSYLENSKIINDKIINKSNKEIEINLQKIKDVEKRVATIVQKLKSRSSNSQRILTDSMSNIKKYIGNMTKMLRNIKNKYNMLSKYDFNNLVDEQKYVYSQGNNSLIVRVHKKINLYDLSKNQFDEMFNNYRNLDNGLNIVEKMFLKMDYGEYYFSNIHNRKDGRRTSYNLQMPTVQPSVYLKYDEEDEKNWIDLSPGQRADMLLNIILLNDSNKILIIDQPEDDLDNETIFRKIVKRIRELKSKRQIIIVTHNANLAITADCDYLIICQSNKDDTYGIINDTMESLKKYNYSSINNDNSFKQTALEIATEILDGGKEALKRRVKKIGYKNLFLE